MSFTLYCHAYAFSLCFLPSPRCQRLGYTCEDPQRSTEIVSSEAILPTSGTCSSTSRTSSSSAITTKMTWDGSAIIRRGCGPHTRVFSGSGVYEGGGGNGGGGEDGGAVLQQEQQEQQRQWHYQPPPLPTALGARLSAPLKIATGAAAALSRLRRERRPRVGP